jgi:uncharacterized protein YcnI
MKNIFVTQLVSACALLAAAAAVYRATLRVGHGCDGAQPMPKPG